MRRVLTVLVAAAYLALCDAAAGEVLHGQSAPPSGDAIRGDPEKSQGRPIVRDQQGGIIHELEGGREGGKEASTRVTRFRGVRPRRPRAPVYYVTFPTFDTLPDGTRCVRMIRRAYPSPLAAAVEGDTQNVLSRLTASDYPPCPGTRRPETAPAAEAAAYWRVAGEDLLPKPDPHIAPGYMLAGKRAYLEARTVPAATFTHPTPLGLLTIEATSGDIYVDWGDGAGLRGPYEGPGEAWPHGKITHFWTDVGTYDVRVQQRWTARWRLATGESGELETLTTEAVLEDFEVRQLQAVRNR